MKKIISILVILALAGILGWRLFTAGRVRETVESEGLSRVIVEEVLERTVNEKIIFPGEIKGDKEVLVFPDVPGILRQKVKAAGSPVKKGETILKIDRDEEALDYSMAEVDSPVSGNVLEIIPEIGSRVSPSQPVARVGNTETMEAAVYTAPELAPLLKTGQKAEIFAAVDDKPFRGTVSEIGAALDMGSRKFPVKIKVSNRNNLLKSGMVCRVEITVNTVKGPAVPKNAVVEREGEKGVFIVDKKSFARWLPVRILAEGEEYRAVTGIERGMKVVSEGNFGLIPDRKVVIAE